MHGFYRHQCRLKGEMMGTITVVGLGPGDPGLITLEVWESIKEAQTLLLRTQKHPTALWLQSRGILFSSYDAAYEEKESFEDVYQAIVGDLVQRAQKGENIVYAVPGSPLVAERTVTLLRERTRGAGIEMHILAGMSFLEVLYVRLGIDPIEGMTVADSADIASLPASLSTGLVVTQVYNRQVASDLKLTLMETHPDDYKVKILQNLGLPNEQIKEIALYELDRQSGIDHLTSVFVPAKQSVHLAKAADLMPLADVMARLRSPDGCVWDREQTHVSLRKNLIEEAYEVIEAIDLDDADLLCEELGDLLLQVVFHARMAEEEGQFSLQDVINGITEKLIRRHPHVFGSVTVKNSGEVIANWEEIKRREKAAVRKSVLDGVPNHFPALLRADKLQRKAAKVGFDWDNIAPVWDKINEEAAELKQAVEGGNPKEMEDELGDVLFSIVNLARFLDVDPESALNGTCRKFFKRFTYIEKRIAEKGLNWKDLTLEMLDQYWEAAKNAKKT